ncbi:MAG: threonine synthase, partial [Boseongicola sp.]|nr:threonine synthase [Boseongicola sp.]
ILHRTLESGAYTKEGVTPSICPSMDIQVSSNFERALFEAYGRDGGAVAQLMDELKGSGGFPVSQGAIGVLRDIYGSGRASEAETSQTISAMLERTGEILCPHTAVGVKVAEEQGQSATPMITLATAHAAKFPDAVEAATGVRPPLPNRMGDLYQRSERVTRVGNDLGEIEALIRKMRAK